MPHPSVERAVMTKRRVQTGNATAGTLDAPVQPREIDPADPLFDFEQSAEAQHLARLAADQDLVSTLQWCNFDPATPEWKQLAQALVEYGYSVFKGWLIKGSAYQRARERGVRGLHRMPEGLRLPPDEAHALAAQLMIVSVEAFRTRVLMRGKWHWKGGASLKTFFVGQCLFRLPGVYRRWRQQEAVGVPIPLSENTRRDRIERELDPARIVHERMAQESLLARIKDQVAREMFALRGMDLSYAAIAERLETTESSVRTRLSRARKQMEGAQDGSSRSTGRHL